MGVLTLYSMYVERGTFVVALEKPEAGLVSNFISCHSLSRNFLYVIPLL